MNLALESAIRRAADRAGISTSLSDSGRYPTLGQLLVFFKAMQSGENSPQTPKLYDGVFEGILESLQLQKRHTDRVVELMYTAAREFDGSERQRKELARATEDAMEQLSKHSKCCTDFFGQFGDRLTLKD